MSKGLREASIWNTCRSGTHADLEHMPIWNTLPKMFHIGICSKSANVPYPSFFLKSVPNPSFFAEKFSFLKVFQIRLFRSEVFQIDLFLTKNKQKSAKKFNIFSAPARDCKKYFRKINRSSFQQGNNPEIPLPLLKSLSR